MYGYNKFIVTYRLVSRSTLIKQLSFLDKEELERPFLRLGGIFWIRAILQNQEKPLNHTILVIAKSVIQPLYQFIYQKNGKTHSKIYSPQLPTLEAETGGMILPETVSDKYVAF